METAEIFKTAVEHGFYKYQGFMCCSIRDMADAGTITEAQQVTARLEIKEFMQALADEFIITTSMDAGVLATVCLSNVLYDLCDAQRWVNSGSTDPFRETAGAANPMWVLADEAALALYKDWGSRWDIVKTMKEKVQ